MLRLVTDFNFEARNPKSGVGMFGSAVMLNSFQHLLRS
jgi:hypothetical protein